MNKIFTCVGMFLIALAIIYGLKGAMKSKKTKEGFLGGSTLTTDFFIPTYQACRAQASLCLRGTD